jgi:NAD(P)-dependent dehydrogenase (short-subunit alcohol dehydrogenase family)
VPSTPSTPTLPRRPKPKTYFLTGASRGLGLECVRQLCSNPFNTIIAGVRSTTSSSISTLKALNEQNKNIHIIECNVSDPISLSALEFRVAEILSISGANLDYIFNLAGMSMNNNNSFSSSDTFLTLDPTVFQAQMQANVLGPAKIIQSLRRYLARGAVVMNLSSGLGGLPRSCTYSISMAALQRLTVHAARDLKPMGVRVVCMEPGAKGGGEVTVRVEGMLRVVGGLGERDSGGWFRWDGGSMMW